VDGFPVHAVKVWSEIIRHESGAPDYRFGQLAPSGLLCPRRTHEALSDTRKSQSDLVLHLSLMKY